MHCGVYVSALNTCNRSACYNETHISEYMYAVSAICIEAVSVAFLVKCLSVINLARYNVLGEATNLVNEVTR